jgi:hypothetical protein
MGAPAMPQSGAAGRLRVAESMRQTQHDWLANLQEGVRSGRPFAICASDEFEELFHLFGVPALVINYWHNLVVATGHGDYYRELLSARGYDTSGMGPLGYAAALDPSRAPWGGLPRPLILLGSTREEAELRFTELWARELGCPFYPLDFNLAAPYRKIPPDGWWRMLRSHWPELVDADQLELRVAEIRNLIAHMEVLTGRTFSVRDLAWSLALLNEQMDLWQETLDLIAGAPVCPVSLRDQLAMYQAMWHRGTPLGVDVLRRYRDEVAERVAGGARGYATERHRLLFWSGDHEPRFHRYLQERHGAVFVGNLYSASPPLYARDFDPDDPLRALCGRNLFLVAHETPTWLLDVAQRLRCDGIIVREKTYPHSPIDQQVCEQAGIAYLNVPHLGDDAEVRALLDRFIVEKLA